MDKYKTTLDHLIVPKSGEVLKKHKHLALEGGLNNWTAKEVPENHLKVPIWGAADGILYSHLKELSR